ncbi:MAG: hypothetical protein MJ201_04470 [Mycoplasmoidaceae bacterium]|nr:hypothetical protein [Mycoplasmoidaceae bacterium]
MQKSNYTIEKCVMTVKYVSKSELEQLKKIEKDFIEFLNNTNFDVKEIKYEFNQVKQNRILEQENIRKNDIAKLIAQSQKMMGQTEVYDRRYKVSGEFIDIKEIDDSYVNSNINIAGEIVSCEKKTPKKNGNVTVYEFIVYDYVGGALKCSFIALNSLQQYPT